MNDLNIEKRIENVLNILNGLTLTGFQQFNSVAEAMKQLAALNRDIREAEAKKESPAGQSEKPE